MSLVNECLPHCLVTVFIIINGHRCINTGITTGNVIVAVKMLVPCFCRLNKENISELQQQVEDLQKALQTQGAKPEDVSVPI